MAFKLADALVYLASDDSKLSSGLEDAKGKTQSFASTATSLLGGAVVGASVAAAGAIIGIGTAAFNVSQDTATATADIAASLGLPIEEAQKFADVARQVYGNNFADSVQDAGAAVAELAKQLGLTADDPALQTLTENAFRLRDVFGVDVNESVDAVKTLMENFGVSSEEAFDMLAAGYQKGLDRSGDFLDTIGEYSTQFANGGATAGEFFSLLESGLQGGMLGTDKAADAFKEFRLRIQDGSSLTAESLAAIGLNVEDITAGLSDGTLTAADAFQLVQQALINTEDPVVRFNAGVGLIGSQFEDLGDKAAMSLSMTTDWAEGSAGAIESLDAKYATFGSAVEGIWRRLTVSISPFTDKLLEMVNDAMPHVMAAFDTFDEQVVPAIEGVVNAISTMVEFVKPLFATFATSAGEATGPLLYLKEWVDTNLPLIQKLFETVLGAIQGFWGVFGDDITTIVNNTFEGMKTVIGTVLATIGDIITLALQILTGDWEGAWETFRGIFERIWETIKTVVGLQLDSLKTLFSNIDWGKVGETLINAVLDGIKLVWTGLSDWVAESLQALWNSITGVNWSEAGKSIVNSTKAGAESVWSNFSSWVQTSAESLLDYWNTTTWEQKGKDAISAIKTGSEAAYQTYRESLAGLIDGVLGFFTGEDWTGTGDKLISDIEQGIENAWNGFLEYLGPKALDIFETFTSIDWAAAGKSIVEGIKSGIEGAWSEFSEWFMGRLQELANWLPFSEPKNPSSPLRNLGKSGASFVTNWWEGASREFDNLRGNLSLGLGDLLGTLNNGASGLQFPQAATGGMSIIVNVSGNNATYENGRAVGRGILDEMRKRGY